jgi:hypothetical protein
VLEVECSSIPLEDGEESRIWEQAFQVEFQGRVSLPEGIQKQTTFSVIILTREKYISFLYSDACM